jgi:nickel-dependent lactate racemase
MKVTNPNGVNLGLYVRSNKGRGSVIRTLPAGTEIKVFDISTTDIALQIDPYKDEWIAGFSGGKKYLTVVKIIGSKEDVT